MRMPPFTLHTPNNLAKALSLAAEFDEFDWISGGTDLLPNYKWKLNPKPDVISLSKVQELTALSGTVIGAMVRIHDSQTVRLFTHSSERLQERLQAS